MGLDFDKCEAHWSYSGFNSFRAQLAKRIGINLRDMCGFQRDDDGPGLSWETVTDPIKPFLDHSDCEGKLTPKECATIAPRLRELLQSDGINEYDKHHGNLLADGMEECAKNGVPLKFQ